MSEEICVSCGEGIRAKDQIPISLGNELWNCGDCYRELLRTWKIDENGRLVLTCAVAIDAKPYALNFVSSKTSLTAQGAAMLEKAVRKSVQIARDNPTEFARLSATEDPTNGR